MRKLIDPKVDVVATRNVKDLNTRKELISVLSSFVRDLRQIRGLVVGC